MSWDVRSHDGPQLCPCSALPLPRTWLKASSRKPMFMPSTIGLRPVMAAPIPMPMKPFSVAATAAGGAKLFSAASDLTIAACWCNSQLHCRNRSSNRVGSAGHCFDHSCNAYSACGRSRDMITAPTWHGAAFAVAAAAAWLIAAGSYPANSPQMGVSSTRMSPYFLYRSKVTL